MIKNENGKIVIKVKDANQLFSEFLMIVDGVREAALENDIEAKDVKSSMELAFNLGMMSPDEISKLDKVKDNIEEIIKELDEMFGGKK